MLVDIKISEKAYNVIMSISEESGIYPHIILDELIMGNQEDGIDEFNQESE